MAAVNQKETSATTTVAENEVTKALREENTKLKEENAKLKKENESLKLTCKSKFTESKVQG